jgi:hypothetical protein
MADTTITETAGTTDTGCTWPSGIHNIVGGSCTRCGTASYAMWREYSNGVARVIRQGYTRLNDLLDCKGIFEGQGWLVAVYNDSTGECVYRTPELESIIVAAEAKEAAEKAPAPKPMCICTRVPLSWTHCPIHR